MRSAPVHAATDRSERIDYVSSQLLPRAALVCRQLVSQLGGELSRTEVGLLNTLSDGPRRITELAELEQLAQPTMTLLVKRLEQEGLVNRERKADDRRVVAVSLTAAGTAALEDFRTQASAALGAHLAEMPDDQVEALADATETLALLVTHLQQGPQASEERLPHDRHSADTTSRRSRGAGARPAGTDDA